MTATLSAPAQVPGMVPLRYPERWRLSRAGITNVWSYYDNTFEFPGGRVIFRGTNGAGKSRAMEMLLPFLFHADRRRLDSTGSNNVRLETLMKHGSEGQANRLGYLWLELERDIVDGPEPAKEYKTLGALARYSNSTAEAHAWYFLTPMRVGHDLHLVDKDRQPLSRTDLAAAIGDDNITKSPGQHRERVRAQVFGLTGPSAEERYDGLMALQYVLRAPDVGNRIEDGQLPKILSDALPPLSDQMLTEAGYRLDGLTEARETQHRMEAALGHATAFLANYRRYAASILASGVDEVTTAASELRGVQRDAKLAAKQHDDLVEEKMAADAESLRLDELVDELRSKVEAIKDSPAYADSLALGNLARSVASAKSAARGQMTAAAAARTTEGDEVGRANTLAAQVVEAAEATTAALGEAHAALTQARVPAGTLPHTVAATSAPAPLVVDTIRTNLHDQPEPVTRPAPDHLTISPTDLDDVVAAAQRTELAAQRRAATATARRGTANELAAGKLRVAEAERASSAAQETAETESARADDVAAARDTVARHLAHQWRDWVASDRTHTLLGYFDWSQTAVGPLLLDVDTLLGTDDTSDDTDDTSDDSGANVLVDLNQVAQDAATDARQQLATRVAHIGAAEKSDQQVRGDLLTEQQQLRAEHDPEPPAAAWSQGVPAGAVPLWRCVDFTADLPADAAAGLEGALLASGLLTAAVSADGTVVAGDGQVLVSTESPTTSTPVTRWLRPDLSGPVPAETVAAVLQRVGAGPGSHPTWVTPDGSWGNGPLRGKLVLPVARHIGGAARSSARAARLTVIGEQLRELDALSQEREQERSRVDEVRKDLGSHLRTAPTSNALTTARRLAVDAARRADDAAVNAQRLTKAAHHVRTAWASQDAAHRAACDHTELPYSAEELLTARGHAEAASRASVAAARDVRTVDRHRVAHKKALMSLDLPIARRKEAELTAQQEHESWRRVATEHKTLTETAGAQAQQMQETLIDTTRRLATACAVEKAARNTASTTGNEAAAAEVKVAHAREDVVTAHGLLDDAFTQLGARVQLPGLAAAAVRGGGADLVAAWRSAEAKPRATGAEELCNTITAAVDASKPVEENTLIKAEQGLTHELHGTFEVLPSIENGVRLVDLADDEGHYPMAQAVTRLADQVQRAHAALSEREQKVFTEFVIGGMGEELRRKLTQAGALVEAMNTSLTGITTSQGIKVRLKWKLTADPGAPIARTRELCRVAAAVRPQHETDERVRLLMGLVDEAYGADPTLGYATALKRALDYRTWHHIEVELKKPEFKDWAALTRRTHLSQGERRFVSYVALFAAADAYLSGLPDSGRAPRFIILDDAFAKVDDRTIAELMGLLVKLDLDFCMTGHALWGTFPEVPSLDVYEVRRESGQPAVTTHVHWDGKTRHLVAAR